MQHNAITKPAWANAERTTDISDVWIEECDPENTGGAYVQAYLSADRDGVLSIDGISVEEGDITHFYDRMEAMKFLGGDAIWRAQECEMEAASFEEA